MELDCKLMTESGLVWLLGYWIQYLVESQIQWTLLNVITGQREADNIKLIITISKCSTHKNMLTIVMCDLVNQGLSNDNNISYHIKQLPQLIKIEILILFEHLKRFSFFHQYRVRILWKQFANWFWDTPKRTLKNIKIG